MHKLFLFFKKINFLKEPVLLLLITTIILSPLLFHPYYSIFPQSDVGIYSAWKHFLVENFYKFSSIPLWNPYLFGGAPFIGNSQVGFFYPINILYFLLPINITFNFIFFLDFFLVGLFTFLYARLIGLSRYSSVISGICMTFNGAVMKHLFLGHIVILDSLIWFPLFLYLFEKIIKSRNLKYSIILGLILGIMILAGNVQIPIYTLIAGSIYFYIRLFQERKFFSRKITKFISVPLITIVIGLCLSSIQLLPTFEFSKLSIRSEGVSYKFASDFSFNPKQLLVIIFPSLFGSDINNSYWGIGSFWSSSIYSGIFPFFLAIIGLIYKRNKYTYSLFILFLFALIYAFGKYSLTFKLFYDYFPFFNNFRVPTRFLFIYAFSLSIFSGFGFEYLLESFKNKNSNFLSKLIKSLSLLLFISSFFYFIGYINKNQIKLFEAIILKNSYAQGIDHQTLYLLVLNDLLRLCFFVFLIIAVFILIKINIIKKRYFFIFAILIITLDYFQFYTKFYKQDFPKLTYQYEKEFKFLKQDITKFRIFSIPNIDANLTSRNRIEILTGYDPLYLASYRNFLWDIGSHENSPYESFITINDIANIDNLRLLNVKYVLSEKTIVNKNLLKVFKGKYNIYKINYTLPRAYIDYLGSPSFTLDTSYKINEARIKHYEPNRIVLDISLRKNGYLILSEQIYPGWNAYDNGKLIYISSFKSIFRSIYLTKGNHTIIFKYEPLSYKIGKTITIVSILLIFLIAAYLRLKQKNEKK